MPIMPKIKIRSISLAIAAAAMTTVVGCGSESQSQKEPQAKKIVVEDTKNYTLADLDEILTDPIKRSDLIVKVLGTTAREDVHAFMKFHVYGYAGENLIPFFTMNNVIVQKWTPGEPGHYSVQHYEVAYYSEFDKTTPIESWTNPITGEVIDDVPHFVLGPIQREFTPEGVIAPGIAPNPLNVSVIGDRVFVPTQSTDKVFNPMSTPEWGEYAGDPDVYWDSMLTYSADVNDVLNENLSRAKAEIHMQNLVSWNPFMKMGLRPGRTMVRAYGTHLDSLDDIPPEVRAGLKKYTPEIFETDTWEEMRIDAVDYMLKIQDKLAAEQAQAELPGGTNQ